MTFSSVLSILKSVDKRMATMETVDIDKTIQNLLQKYSVHIGDLLSMYNRNVEKAKRKGIKPTYNTYYNYHLVNDSYKYLLQVVAEPKKFLYNETGVSGKKQNTPSHADVLKKLEPVLNLNGGCGMRLLRRLCETISHHMKYTQKDNWFYYGPHTFDEDAEMVLKLNKTVHLLDKSDFVRFFKDMLPTHRFAVPAYAEKTR